MGVDRTQYRRFSRSAGGAAETRASPAALWRVITGIGGENRYYALDFLWDLREAMDAVVGGPGRARVRPAGPLKVGDHIDSWDVVAVEPERRLALGFNMKAPGAGVLELRILPGRHARSRLEVAAFWQPDGLAGELYWAAMKPPHLILFRRMTAAMCDRAEREERAERRVPAAAAPAPL